VFGFLGAVVLTGAAWILGDNIRTRRAYLRELEDKAVRLEREREESARRAAAEEQSRMARELHDVIAHGVSVMVLQASGGREVIDADPTRAREALRSIEETGREALTELRRLLGVADERAASLAPQPGLPQLETLVDQVRGAGLPVALEFEGPHGDVPAGVELSAYRVVQEALTNTLRHAFARQAWVFVRRRDDELEVEVLDDGAGPPPQATTGGHGLVGMRERVGLFGGELQAGQRIDGGFRVRARFPLGGETR
jgi:signal transduction histidine kinase